jgi:hypothetical protein
VEEFHRLLVYVSNLLAQFLGAQLAFSEDGEIAIFADFTKSTSSFPPFAEAAHSLSEAHSDGPIFHPHEYRWKEPHPWSTIEHHGL